LAKTPWIAQERPDFIRCSGNINAIKPLFEQLV